MNLIPPRHWNHLQGSDNPADGASRGLYTKQLEHNETRWYGLNWLKDSQLQWPTLMKQELLEDPVSAKNERSGAVICGN